MPRKKLTWWFIVIKDFEQKGLTPEQVRVMLYHLAEQGDLCVEQEPGNPKHLHVLAESHESGETLQEMFNAEYCEPCRDVPTSRRYLQKDGEFTHKAYTSIEGTYTRIEREEVLAYRHNEKKNRRRRILRALERGALSHRQIAKNEGVSHTFVDNLAQSLNHDTSENQQNAAQISDEVATRYKTIIFPTLAETEQTRAASAFVAHLPASASRARICNIGDSTTANHPKQAPTAVSTHPKQTRSTGMLYSRIPVDLSTSAPHSIANAADHHGEKSVPKSMHPHGRACSFENLRVASFSSVPNTTMPRPTQSSSHASLAA